jgi:hypothetical protein
VIDLIIQSMREQRDLQDPTLHDEQVMIGVGKMEGGFPKVQKMSINEMIKRYEEDEKTAIKEVWETRPMWLKKYDSVVEKLAAAKADSAR